MQFGVAVRMTANLAGVSCLSQVYTFTIIFVGQNLKIKSDTSNALKVVKHANDEGGKTSDAK